jgi:hypothetical protein
MRSILALRSRHKDDTYSGLFFDVPPSPPRQGSLSFRERGFSFIPLRPAHLEFMGAVYAGRSMPTIDQVVGRAMVDEYYLPLGCVLVYFEPGGKNWLYAHFSKWLHVYPKDIRRAMKEVCDVLRQHEIFILHASADKSVDGSDYLLKWLGAEPTGEQDDLGPLYRLDLRKCRI